MIPHTFPVGFAVTMPATCYTPRGMPNIVTVVDAVGCAQGLFLIAVLMKLGRESRRANRWLIVLLSVLTAVLVFALLHHTRLIFRVPHLFGISPFFSLLYGPPIYLYIMMLVRPEASLSRWHLLHIVPFIAQIWAHRYYLFLDPELKVFYIQNIFEDQFLHPLNPAALVRIGVLLGYIVAAMVVYQKAHRRLGDGATREQVAIFRWLHVVLGASTLLWTLYVGLYFTDVLILNDVMPFVMTATFFAVGWIGFTNPVVFRSGRAGASLRYARSPLDAAQVAAYRDTIHRVIVEDKAYRDPRFSLRKAAQLTNIPVNVVSQVINECFGQNFSEFVNAARTDEAKVRLLDESSQHLTIEAIASEAGFSSKSAFNSAFRKQTGVTPSSYRQQAGENHAGDGL